MTPTPTSRQNHPEGRAFFLCWSCPLHVSLLVDLQLCRRAGLGKAACARFLAISRIPGANCFECPEESANLVVATRPLSEIWPWHQQRRMPTGHRVQACASKVMAWVDSCLAVLSPAVSYVYGVFLVAICWAHPQAGNKPPPTPPPPLPAQ